MKRKWLTYLSLVFMLGSLIIPSMGVIAETIGLETDQEMRTEVLESNEVVEQEMIKDSSESLVSTTVGEIQLLDLNETETNQKQRTETTSSSEKESRAPSVRKQAPIIVTDVKLTDSEGNSLTNVTQYTDIMVKIDFQLPNNQVNSGDFATIALPEELMLEKDISFNIYNDKGDLIAIATTDKGSSTVNLEFTEYVDTHSDISGSLIFVSKIDTEVIKEETDYPIYIDVNGDKIFGGDIEVEFQGDDEDEKFAKYSWFTNDEGTEIQNVLRVNPTGETYQDVTVEDILKTDGLTYNKESFSIEVGNWEMNSQKIWDFVSEEDVTNQYTIDFSGNSFKIHLGAIGNKEFRILYKTNTNGQPVHGESFKNYAKMTDNQTLIEEVEVERVYQSGSGEANGYNYNIMINKEDEEGNKLSNAIFDIIRDRTGFSVGTITTGIDGSGSIDGLLKDDYTIKEIQAPEGYELLDEEIHITPNDFGEDLSVLKTVVNKKKIELIEVAGHKTWNDGNNQDGIRPKVINVNLLADGEQIATKEVSETTNWTYQFANLPKFKDGKEIVYTVTENQVPDYNTEINGFDLVNNYTPGETSATVTKQWVDENNQDGKRPTEIKVQLLANGEKIGEQIKLNEANQWKYTWNNLPQKENGIEIIYTVEEETIPNYTTTLDDSDQGNIKLINTYQTEKTEVNGYKIWNDNNNEASARPESIVVNLLADGKQVDTKEVSEITNWMYEFTNLPKFKDGKEIVYTVTENTVKEYITKIEGFNIINTYSPGKTSATVTKHWNDNNNQDGIRPDKIKIQLYANDKKYSEVVELNEASQWTFTWENLNAVDESGAEINYTIKEVNVSDGYTATITGKNRGNLLITNSHKPKVKNEGKNPDKKQPSENLPKTGEKQNMIWFQSIGLILMLVVGGYISISKKKSI
ncbi:Cna B-type domain-containing protein [Vagococcus fluvialis]|uniref:Cna B-type domain-containing protein n=1 Tax=Vagococcus fluvialis TaxID=2738 RepID=UPI003B5BF343